MKASAAGIAFVAAWEGIVTRAYRDVAGVWTIGVGHTAAAGDPRPLRGMTITRDEALAILARDLARCETRVAAHLGEDSQTVFDGGVSFDFNTGAIDRASWVSAFRQGDRAAARATLLQWTKAGGRTVAGLVRRREAEARLIFEGDYGGVTLLRPVSAPADDLTDLQRELDALGFYRGPIDGIAGDATKAAVSAYQKSHPDLVVDGIAGPATRAGMARDLAARDAVAGSAGSIATVGAAGGALATLSGVHHPWAIAAAVAVLALIATAIILTRRYGNELKRAVTSTPKDH